VAGEQGQSIRSPAYRQARLKSRAGRLQGWGNQGESICEMGKQTVTLFEKNTLFCYF